MHGSNTLVHTSVSNLDYFTSLQHLNVNVSGKID